MSFLYPRTINVTRPAAQSGVGAIGYGALQASTETPVATGLPANIQLDRLGKRLDAHLPADTAGRSMWRVFIPLASAANGLIHANDVVIDDLGRRYQVSEPYWNSLGYNLLVERLGT